MDYCGPLALPYLEFLGWDEVSRNLALAWRLRENARCGSCGQVKGDWTDGDGKQLHPAPFHVTDGWCPGCEALERHRATKGKEAEPGIHPVFARSEA